MHDAERAKSALSHLDPGCDRDTWVKYGMALKHEFGEAGFEIWDEWSSGSDKYSASAARSTWKSIKANGKRTIAALFFDAKQAGWKDDGKRRRPTKAELEKRRAEAAERARRAEEEDRARHEAAARRAQALWDAAVPCAEHPYLARKGVASYGLRVGRWKKLDEETGEWITVTENGLLIPILDRQRKLWSLQCIPPEANKKKLYLKDSLKSGNFFPIGKPKAGEDGRLVFLLGEGYATCASAHAATGYMTLVCFDVSNLAAVTRSLRERMPEAVIVMLADNDTHADGNPGLTKATAVAREVGACVAVPPPGDMNDLQVAEGLEAVAGVIEAGILAGPLAPEAEPVEESPQESEPQQPEPAPAPAPAIPPDNSSDHLEDCDPSAHFTVLGYDRGDFYVFIHEQRQISVFRPGDLTESNLLMMAPLEWWEMYFPSSGKDGGMNRRAVLNWFFRLAHKRGIYDASRIRGRGAWIDDGRVVYHQGSRLYVDGVATDVTAIRSKHVYELAKSQCEPADVPLSDEDGRRLLSVAKMFRWSKPGAAALLAGWVFLAPVCGAIRWRPHIWLTGGAGSGKSTILNEFVSPLLGEAKVFAQGNSTEAGLRQKLKADALPVLFDESEQNDEGEKRRMAPILALIRQSSTESVAQTYKGTVSGDSLNFHVRSMFCLASIQAGLEHKADQDRLTKLALQKAQDDASAHLTWQGIKEALYQLRRDDGLPGRLLRRAIDMVPVIQKTITVFVDVTAKKFGTQRMGDQYGTLLAGAWSLTRSTVPTPDEAAAMIDAYDWSEFTEGGEIDDPEKALHTLLEAKITHKGEVMSVGSVVTVASGMPVDGLTLDNKLAMRLLREHGMTIAEGCLVFQNNSEALRKLVAGTKFETDLRSQLLRINGARRFGSTRFAPGVVQRGVGIPLTMVTDDEPPI